MTKLKPVNIFLYLSSAGLLLGGATIAYLAFTPVDVLKDWTLKVDSSKEYIPGSVLAIGSTYQKTVQVSGTSHRYLQCQKPGGKDWDGFIPLSESPANRPQTKGSTNTTYSAIPLSLPNLPTNCRVYINVDYTINPFKTTTEQNYSNEFKVIPRPDLSKNQAASNNEVSIYTNEPVVAGGSQSSSITLPQENRTVTIYSESAAPAIPEDSPRSENPNPNILQRILNPVGNVLNRIGL